MRRRLKTMKNKLLSRRNRTRKIYGEGLMDFLKKKSNTNNDNNNKSLPFMYFYIFEKNPQQE